jgi:hypothetical protein
MIARKRSGVLALFERPHEIEKMASMLKIPGKVFMVACRACCKTAHE